MKSKLDLAVFSVCCSIAAILAACATKGSFSRADCDEHTITVRIQSTVDEELIAGTNMGLVTTFVWVDVLDPSQIRGNRVKLILQRADARQLKRIAPGEKWHEVGSVQTLHVIVDKVSHEFFLWPPESGG